MKYIIGSRQSGKTTSLIITAIKEKRVILSSCVQSGRYLEILLEKLLDEEPELKEFLKSGERRPIILTPKTHFEITRVIGIEPEVSFKELSFGYLDNDIEILDIKRKYKVLIDDADVILLDLIKTAYKLNIDGLSFNINDKMGDSKKKYYFEIED